MSGDTIGRLECNQNFVPPEKCARARRAAIATGPTPPAPAVRWTPCALTCPNLFGRPVAEAKADAPKQGFDPSARFAVHIAADRDRRPARGPEIEPTVQLSREVALGVEIQFARGATHANHVRFFPGEVTEGGTREDHAGARSSDRDPPRLRARR